MICQEALEWISQDVDGLLDEVASERLRRHLAECPACQKVRQDFQTNRVLMRSLSPVEVPDGAWGRLLQKIVSQPAEVGEGAPNRGAGEGAPNRGAAPAELPALPAQQQAPAPVAVLKPRRATSTPVKVFQAVAAMLVVFMGGLTLLGWNESSPLDGPMAAGDVGAVIQGHALAASSDPLNDRARWHYVATEPRETKGVQTAVYQPASLGYPPAAPGSPAQFAVPASYSTTTRVRP